MSELTKQIFEIGVVPLIVLEDVQDAVPLAKALVKGGIPVAEVTFRTDAALDIIKEIAQNVPQIILGAGTVHNVKNAQLAIEAGAKFIVTPGFNAEVIAYCVQNNIDVLPGCVSPADIEQALSFGLDTVKFFPAEAYGGIKTLKTLAGPYGGVQFMPTGGVNTENMADYLALPNVAAVGGSFVTPDNLIKEKRWEDIALLCRQVMLKILNFSLVHVGINTQDQTDGLQTANTLATLFGTQVTEFPTAYFAGSMFEVIKGSYLGTKGHIAIQTADIDRAVAYYQRNGVAFNPDTFVHDDKGHLLTVYFKDEVAGFALHLRRK